MDALKSRLDYQLAVCADLRSAGACPLAETLAGAQRCVAAAEEAWQTEHDEAERLRSRNELLETVIVRLAGELGVKPPAGTPLEDYLEERIGELEAERAEELAR